MPLVPDQMVNGRYRIVSLLGQGGFGAVYQVWDINLERFCALKENLDTSEKIRRQFEREARILANLSHPNLPRVTDHFNIPDQGQYLVMDFVEGEDLEVRLNRLGKPLVEAQVLDWIGQVCEALSYMHRHDPPIIHRDIKPANIRITPQGRAMLVDFGIAKMLNPNLRTTVGARAVTPGYSPPEQYGQGPTDERSDIYALGATLYTLLTGKVPPDSVDVMAGSLPPAAPAARVNKQVSPAVSQAVEQAMSLGRMERFQNVEAMRLALRREPGAEGIPPGARKPSIEMVPGAPSAHLAGAVAAGGMGPQAQAYPPSMQPIVVPVGRPSSKSNRKKPFTSMAFMGLGGMGLVLLAGLAGFWLIVEFFQTGAVSTPALTGAAAGEVLINTTPEAPTAAPALEATATDTPIPTDTPGIPPEQGAQLVLLPPSRIAFVSDHGGDGKDQIYITAVKEGSYWIDPLDSSNHFQLDPANPVYPFSDLARVPAVGNHDLAWWPDWCAGNTKLLFEGQDTHDINFQTLYQVDMDGNTIGQPKEITWEGFSKIGVPRCAHHSRQALASALDGGGQGSWRMLSFDLDRPTEPEMVGDGFPFSGFASWSGDDRWFAFMHSENGQPFQLFRMAWDDVGNFQKISSPQGIAITRFPAVSPVDDANLAYACSNTDQWALCLQNLRENTFSYLEKNLGMVNEIGRVGKPTISGVTPTWAPDGEWIAFSSSMDGDWDIYLYHLGSKALINITQQLAGDQFQPSWSKP